tara:strand:- start:939 stop:1538 length:600 start_codon:yes stop_codon:yes gene_type:complete
MEEKVSYLRCTAPKCDNPLIGQRRKYCSYICSRKSQEHSYKEVYSAMDWAGGPRGMISASSVKKDESFVGGNDRWCNHDYGIDPDIFEIAVQNHENLMLARAEHEAMVVYDGLNIFKESYNQNHETSYETTQARKQEVNLTEDERELRNLKQKNASKEYYAKNREYLSERQRKRYAENIEKYRRYSREYYAKNKNKSNP